MIALPAGNAAKQKSLHALGMVPAAHMDASALNARPEGATGSPYEAAAASRKRSAAESRDEELGVPAIRFEPCKPSLRFFLEPNPTVYTSFLVLSSAASQVQMD